MKLTAASDPVALARKVEILAGLDAPATELPLEQLMDLVGQLARAQAVASLRIGHEGTFPCGGQH